MVREKSGIVSALGIAIFPIITLFFIYPYSRALSFREMTSLYTSPAVIIYLAAVIIAVSIYSIKQFRLVDRYMKTTETALLEDVQKLLVGYPKKMLLAGIVIGILTPQVLLFFHPGGNSMRTDAGVLGFGNVIFFGMPMYIIFTQHFETWARTVPFSEQHQSMKLSARVNLVSAFIVLSISTMLMITLKNSFQNLSETATFELILNLSAPILAVGICGGFVNMFLLMRGITKRIQLCQKYADSLSQGDISERETIAVSRDELGLLADRLTQVRLNMHGLIGSAKETIDESLEVKDELGMTAGKAVTAAGSLTDQINTTVSQIELLDERIDGTTGSVNRFSERIKNLTNGIMDQAAMTEESNAAITEIIASVENISEVARVKIGNSTALIEASDEGNSKITETVSRMNEIGEQVGRINEITGLIQAIAAQTNLLAMNAAIEAAHAGDAGRGFAVVADEIRKLAANASDNSKQINESIKQIIDSISSANESGESSAKSFKKIESEVQNVIQSFQEIDAGLSELKVGGVHILEAITSLNDSSQELKTDADAMKEETEQTSRTVSDLRDLSEQTYRVTEKMSKEVANVREQAVTIREQASRLDNSTTRASESLKGFNT